MGFPDGWTAVPYRGKPAADGPRYKALGNSMAVNVMRWIGMRIEMVSNIQEAAACHRMSVAYGRALFREHGKGAAWH